MKHFRQYIVAETVAEAVGLKKAVGAKALYLAGGTVIVPFGARSVEVLIDISRIGLSRMESTGESLSLGATVRIADLLNESVRSACTCIYTAARVCGTPLIRNMATLGGNLAGAYLPSDLGVALAAVGAEVRIAGDAERQVPIGDLLAQGWLKGNDLVTHVIVRKHAADEGSSYRKFGRGAVDIALVSAGAAVRLSGDGLIERLTIALGQTSSMPVVISGGAVGAVGQRMSVDLIKRIASAASDSVKPRSDAKASGEYRRQLTQVAVAEAVFEAADEAGWRAAGPA